MSKTAREILIRPLMTEKSMRQKEEQNTVTFRVRPDANKVEIRSAIEEVFNVKVASVRTASFEGKMKRMGRHQGQGCLQQILRPAALVQRLPHRLALQALHRPNAGLAAPAPLGHALQAFQGVEAVTLERPVAELHRLGQFAVARQL